MSNLRKSPRAQWIDYDGGLFFITICTKNRVHYFGSIRDGEMHLSEIGKIVDLELSHSEIHHPEIKIPLYVVMPNHIHAIVAINPDITRHTPTDQRNPNPSQRPNPDMARHVKCRSKFAQNFVGTWRAMSNVAVNLHKNRSDMACHVSIHKFRAYRSNLFAPYKKRTS